MRRRSARNEKRKLEESGAAPIPKAKPGRKKTKASSKSAATIPIIPEGETEETLEYQRQQLVDMHRNGDEDMSKVNQMMESTYPLRRRKLLLEHTRAWQLLQDYPWFKDCRGHQVSLSIVIYCR